MSTHRDDLAGLLADPTPADLRRDRIERLIGWVAAAVSVMAFTVAVIAAVQRAETTSCVNVDRSTLRPLIEAEGRLIHLDATGAAAHGGARAALVALDAAFARYEAKAPLGAC